MPLLYERFENISNLGDPDIAHAKIYNISNLYS
jgi:hypothetical protein